MATATKTPACCCGHKPSCDPCPVCTGLECLERPRFFAGQLLTEAELGGEQDYHRAKHRLHNLHLHGWGVVCGLEVVCHECEGWVTVQSGYAIDPCGEDVIVCKDHPIDVAEMIRECKRARRQRLDCDRLTPRPSEKRGPEHWCITLRYAEQETKPTTALRRKSCDACRCGPGCACSCPCHGEAAQRSERSKGPESTGRWESQGRSGVGRLVAPCEPTRILETYCLEVCEAPEDFCERFESEAERSWREKFQACIEGLRKVFVRAPVREIGTLADVHLAAFGISTHLGSSHESSPAVLHDSFCRVRDFLLELLRRNPGNLHCSVVDRLAELECPRPGPNDTAVTYMAAYRPSSEQLLGFLWLYLVDCLCWAALPPCAPCCPGEDELILACLEVTEGRDGSIHIEHICNTSCRRYAGAFPPTFKGVHLGPIWPLVSKVIDVFCCGDFLERVLSFVRTSENGLALARFAADDDFARARLASDAVRSLRLTQVLGTHVSERLNLAALMGRPVDDAASKASELGVEMEIREVETPPPTSLLRALPAANRGDRVVAYARGGEILGFARPGSTEASVVDQGIEIAALRRELSELRGDAPA